MWLLGTLKGRQDGREWDRCPRRRTPPNTAGTKMEESTSQEMWAPLKARGLPWWLRGQRAHLQCRRCRRPGFDPWVGKIPCRRRWQPTPVISPEKSHGRRSLVGYSSKGGKELDTTEHTLLAQGGKDEEAVSPLEPPERNTGRPVSDFRPAEMRGHRACWTSH